MNFNFINIFIKKKFNIYDILKFNFLKFTELSHEIHDLAPSFFKLPSGHSK